MNVMKLTRPWDVAVVGAGPAGLACAINAASEGLKTVVYGRWGGQAHQSARIENYPGFPFGVSGRDLAAALVEQAERLGAVLVPHQVVALDAGLDDEGCHAYRESGADLGDRARAVVLATGVAYRRLEVPGAEHPRVRVGAGADVAHRARGTDVVVIGGGNSAAQAAAHLANFARQVTMLVRGASLAATASEYLVDRLSLLTLRRCLEVRYGTEVVGFEPRDNAVRCVVSSGDPIVASLVVVHIGGEPRTGWLGDAVPRERGYVLTGADAPARPALARGGDVAVFDLPLMTALPGVFAVGDARARSVKRVTCAIGEGAAVVPQLHRYLAELGARR